MVKANGTNNLIGQKMPSPFIYSFCLYVCAFTCVALSYFLVYNWLNCSKDMLLYNFKSNRGRVCALAGLSFFYRVGGITVLPTFFHVLWLLLRFLFLTLAIFMDALSITLHTRFEEATFQRRFGNGRKKGYMSYIILFVIFIWAVLDIMRHALLIFVTEKNTVFDFGMENPLIPGNRLEVTNEQIAMVTYATNMLYGLQCVFKFAQSSFAHETVMISTS